MAFSLSIPLGKPNELLNLTVDVGELLFILGANGTGKSSLMQAFGSASQSKTRRITAHRQTWFRSGSPEFTGRQRADYEQNVFHHDRQATARWMDDYAQQRAQMAIYDYYHPDVQKLAGEKLAGVVGGDLDEKVKRAKEDALKAIRQNAEHLSDRIAEKAGRAQVFSLLPKKGEIGAGGKRTAELDFQKIGEDEAVRLEALIDASDFVEILKRYPIRESPALDAIAKALNFANRTQYEAAVRKLLADDQEAVQRVRALLGALPADLVT
jgi:hypothetical protein